MLGKLDFPCLFQEGLKLSMRDIEVDGVTYTVPAYVGRIKDAWLARPPKQKTTQFVDVNYGGAAQALRECVYFMQDIGCLCDSTKRQERQSKEMPLGAPGVFLRHSPKRGRRAAAYYLYVVLPDRERTTIYVGTQDTYEKRLPAKIEEAIARQDEVRVAQARKILELVNGLSAQAVQRHTSKAL